MRPSEIPAAAGRAEAPPPAPAPAGDRHEMEHLIGKTVDGLRIEKMLGAGGMGAVFLAHQASLDRKVAVKVLPSRFVDHPEMLARFTREALSAAQLNHHNVVQVFDVGSEDDLHYISMEYVRGDSLGGMIRKGARLQVDDAAGYVLQAARGLKYAHEHGIIHRDIKPDNLMVNDNGIVKIADMGLAKMRGQADIPAGGAEIDMQSGRLEAPTDLTQAEVAMGTPAYMAPEQGRDAASVGPSADQYSLGCTLYYLCAGKAPYSGTTVFELLEKHIREPLTPLDAHVRGVPATFNAIISRMLAKTPEERYPDMDGVIKDLESYLGVESEKGPYTPREQHAGILEDEERNYYAAGGAKKRRLATIGFFALLPVLFLVTLFVGRFSLAGGFLGFLLLTPLSNFIIDGLKNKTYLFRRVRSVFFGMPITSWLGTIAGGLGVLAVLYVLSWLWFWIGFAVLAFGLAVGYQWAIVRPLRTERAGPIETTRAMLRELRLRGVSEDAIQDFVCRFSGVHWEEFFEDLFDYEAMIHARAKWAEGDKEKRRKRFSPWREPIARWVDEVEEGRKKTREKKQLAKVEAKVLKKQGLSDADAQKKAEASAAKIVDEGLIKKKTKADAADFEGFKAGRRAGRIAKGFRAIRAVAGIAIAVGGASTFVALPGAITDVMTKVGYFGWGFGESAWALLAGGALLASAFSSRMLMALLVVAGAGVIVMADTVSNLAAQPLLTPWTALLGGLGLIAVGIGLPIMHAARGRQF